MSTSALARSTGLKRIAAYRHLVDLEVCGWVHSTMGTGERPCRPPVVEEIMMMAPATARTSRETTHRLSDCVTALLRDQPFFGSLALRLPIRVDASRETIASDGHEIRYSPEWVADTDAGSHQDGNWARGAGLHFEAPHAAG